MTCTFDGCDRPATRREWCSTHYRQWLRGRPLTPIRPRGGLCDFDGCDEPVRSLGLCDGHYKQQRAGQKLKPVRRYAARVRTIPLPEPTPEPPTDWREAAACRDDAGFLDDLITTQIATCHRCPVRQQCLDYGLSISTPDPKKNVMWGGLTAAQIAAAVTKQKTRTEAA